VAISAVLETCLYADDLDAAERFFSKVLGLDVFSRETGRHVFFRCGTGMFLVFNAVRTSTTVSEVDGARIPAHGASGAGHVAFRIAADELAAWRSRLADAGIAIETEVHWPNGGRSLYVRDPAGNSVELATASIWGLHD